MIRPNRKLYEDMAKGAMTRCPSKEEIVKKLFNYIEYLEKSIGSCSKCKHLGEHKQTLGIGIKKYECLVHPELRVTSDFYCEDFKEKK